MITCPSDTNVPNFGKDGGAKIVHVLLALILGFGGNWRFLTRVLHLDLDLDIVRKVAWIIPEVLFTLRSVEAQIQSVYNQYN